MDEYQELMIEYRGGEDIKKKLEEFGFEITREFRLLKNTYSVQYKGKKESYETSREALENIKGLEYRISKDYQTMDDLE